MRRAWLFCLVLERGDFAFNALLDVSARPLLAQLVQLLENGQSLRLEFASHTLKVRVGQFI